MLANRKFTTMDVWKSPGDLSANEAVLISNMYTEAGVLVSRQGVVGQFDTPLANPIYDPLPYLNGSGGTNILFASGAANSTTGGKWYQALAGATTYTEITQENTDSFSLNASGFFQSRLGPYDYAIDGSQNQPIRTTLSGNTGETATGIAAPTVAPVPSLTSVVLDPLSSASGWQCDEITDPGNLLPSSGNLATAGFVDTKQYGPGQSGGDSVGGYGATGNWGANTAGGGTFPLPSGYTALYAGIGQPLDSIFTLSSMANSVISNTLGGETRYCRQFFVGGQYYQGDPISRQALAITVNVFSDSGGTDLIGSQTKVFNPTYTGQNPGQQFGYAFGFPLGTVEIMSFTVWIAGAPGNGQPSLTAGQPPICVSVASLIARPIGNGVTFVPQNNGLLIQHDCPTPTATYTQNGTSLEQFASLFGSYAGVRFTKQYSASQNWSMYSILNLTFTQAGQNTLVDLLNAGISMVLGFRQSGSDTHYYSNPLTFSADGTYAAVDITTISSDVLASFLYFEILFTSDMVGLTATTNPLFTLYSIVNAGNLSVNVSTGVAYSPYFYAATWLDGNGDILLINVIESDPGPNSNSITPTPDQATASVFMALGTAPANATFVRIYRFGGVFSDGLGRLIASCSLTANIQNPYTYSDLAIDASNDLKVTSVLRPFVATDVGTVLYLTGGTGFNAGPVYINSVTGGAAFLSSAAGTLSSTGGTATIGDGYSSDNSNPYISWNFATGILIDDTPDSFLFDATILQYGREQPPVGAQCIASWQNRLWLAVGSTLYGSWQAILDQQAGLYFTTANITGDPEAAIKGVTVGLNAADNDNIQAIIPMGSGAGAALVVIKQYSLYVLYGYDPTNFQIRSYLTNAGVGLVAPRAWCIVAGGQANSAGTLWFLGADGVYQFDGDNAENASLPLERILSTRSDTGETLIDPAAFANCAMFLWDRRLYVCAPAPGGSQNSVMYVWDTRSSGWTQYNVAATSGASLTGQTDTNNPYFGGYDGQLYTFEGTTDVATPTSEPAGIPIAFLSRGFGQEGSSSQSAYANLLLPTVDNSLYEQTIPERLYIDQIGGVGGTAWNWQLSASNVNYTQNGTYTSEGAYANQQETIRIKMPTDVQGPYVQIGLTATVTAQTRLRSIGLEAAKGTVGE
jgi:hypothetical protein